MKTVKTPLYALTILIMLSLPAFCFDLPDKIPGAANLEFGLGYAHISGNQGMNGYNVDAAAVFSRRVAVAFDYDGVYNTSTLGAFTGTSIGQVVSRAHQQDFLIGPRIYFPGLIKSKNKEIRLLHPFAELQFGGSHLTSSVRNATIPINLSSSDTAFSWMLGGAADYKLSPRWVGRVKVDLLRTHFSNAGQSHLRFVLGVAYNFRERRW